MAHAGRQEPREQTDRQPASLISRRFNVFNPAKIVDNLSLPILGVLSPFLVPLLPVSPLHRPPPTATLDSLLRLSSSFPFRCSPFAPRPSFFVLRPSPFAFRPSPYEHCIPFGALTNHLPPHLSFPSPFRSTCMQHFSRGSVSSFDSTWPRERELPDGAKFCSRQMFFIEPRRSRGFSAVSQRFTSR